MRNNNGVRPFAVVVAMFLLLSWLRLEPGSDSVNAVSDGQQEGPVEELPESIDPELVGPDPNAPEAKEDPTRKGPIEGPLTNAACNSSNNGGATDKGVTANRIKLATTAVLDGPAKTLLEDSPKAMKAVVDKVNRGGGICGRLLDLRVVNDSFQADTGLRNIRSFIDEQYFALPVMPSAEGLGAAILNGEISKAKIPVIGSDGMRKEQYSDPYVWPVASATVTAMRVMAKYGATKRGTKTFAIVYDEKYKFGVEGKDAFEAQVKAMGGTMVPGATVGLNPDDNSYASAINDFNNKCRDNRCDMVALLLLPETAKKWLQGGATFGARYTAGAQTLFTDRFAQDCVLLRGPECGGFAVWTGYNPPIGGIASKPGVAAYVADVKAVKPSIDINNQFVEGAYLGMNVFVEALRRTGANLTRERLKAVMDSMTFESDLASPLTWKPGRHSANVRSQSFSMTVSQGAFRGWSDEGTGFLLDPEFGG